MPTLQAQAQAGPVGGEGEGPRALKRKLDEECEQSMDVGDVKQDPPRTSAKRACPEVHPDPEADSGVVLNQAHHHHLFLAAAPPTPLPHPPPTSTPAAQQIGHVEVYGCMKDVISSSSRPPAESHSPNNNLTEPHHPAHLPSPGEERGEHYHWMDMDGETYSPSLDNMEMDMATDGNTPLLPSSLTHHPQASVQWPL